MSTTIEDAYIIKGGKPLTGEIKLSGAKNVALKTIIGALLFDSPVYLENIPRINDVQELITLLISLGATVEFIGKNTLKVDGSTLKSNKCDFLHAEKIRTSFLLFAPLLYKFKSAYIPNPGGCRIGARPIDRSVEGLQQLGIQIAYDSKTGYYNAQMPQSPKGHYRFDKPSHTGTELLIMMSVFTQGEVLIENAALEPEIDDLINFLKKGGANISREDANVRVKGVEKLRQELPYSISSDRNEAVTYAIMGVITKGDVTVTPIQESLIHEFIKMCKTAGIGVEKKDEETFRFFYQGPIKAVSITTNPHPGFMTDWQPPWTVLMTQAQGESIIQERIYENRFNFIDELRKLGADIEFVKIPVHDPKQFFFFHFDPAKKYNQAIRIRGPQELHEGVLHVNDLRAGATLALAALTAPGESYIDGASILERGYENFVEKIKSLGGDIEKV